MNRVTFYRNPLSVGFIFFWQIIFPVLSLSLPAVAQDDFFYSGSGLNQGATNSPALIHIPEGSSSTLYVYYDTVNSEMMTGCGLDIMTSTSGVIAFTEAETLGFNILNSGGSDVGDRWPDSSGGYHGPANSVTNNSIEGLNAFSIFGGTGIVNVNTGPNLFDEGYDPAAGAFLFATIEFSVLGNNGDSTSILTELSSIGCANGTTSLNPSFGNMTIMIGDKFVLGDVNCDGVVDLLDVQPFVQLLTGGGFSLKADINQDGVVSLLDVGPFVELLTGA